MMIKAALAQDPAIKIATEDVSRAVTAINVTGALLQVQGCQPGLHGNGAAAPASRGCTAHSWAQSWLSSTRHALRCAPACTCTACLPTSAGAACSALGATTGAPPVLAHPCAHARVPAMHVPCSPELQGGGLQGGGPTRQGAGAGHPPPAVHYS